MIKCDFCQKEYGETVELETIVYQSILFLRCKECSETIDKDAENVSDGLDND